MHDVPVPGESTAQRPDSTGLEDEQRKFVVDPMEVHRLCHGFGGQSISRWTPQAST